MQLHCFTCKFLRLSIKQSGVNNLFENMSLGERIGCRYKLRQLMSVQYNCSCLVALDEHKGPIHNKFDIDIRPWALILGSRISGQYQYDCQGP